MRTFANYGLALAVFSMLAGCGKQQQQQAEAPHPSDVKTGIFLSASDCADTKKLTIEECGKAINAAVKQHDREAPSFKTLGQCTTKFGADRCTQGVDGSYRAQLQAFLVVMGKPPTAEPLYPPAQPSVGFLTISSKPIDAKDDTMIVSAAAMAIASDNGKLAH